MPVPDKSGELIRSHAVLAKRYLKSWFTLDIVSILPFDVVAMTTDSGGNNSGLRSIRLLRVLRLIKLVRVLRASRIIQRWQNAIEMSSSQLSLIGVLIAYIVFVHWFACLWALLPQLYTSWRAAPGFDDALLQKGLEDPSCTGYLGSLVADAPAGLNQMGTGDECLTSCEIDVIASITKYDDEYIIKTEHWLCRSVTYGILPPDYAAHPFLVWLISMEVAVLQFAGSDSKIGPSNPGEFVIYLVALSMG